MLITLIILFFVLVTAGLIFTVNRYNRALPEKKSNALPPPDPALLFTSDVEAEEPVDNRRTKLVERATRGDIAALTDAHANGERNLYDEVLSALIDARLRQGNLNDLVKHIASNSGLRGSVRLTEQVIQSWKLAPDRRSTIEMLHIAALSDDAGTYGKAIEMALEAWQNGKLSGFKPEELITLIESQYWELASEARSGGGGYSLKRQIADVRRDLATATTGR
ncbi:MAG TPA: hypothetical protein VLR90_09950 [Blastocatellia bacterium]|nr:hypothetical protein [Blastocatellia bacterium]